MLTIPVESLLFGFKAFGLAFALSLLLAPPILAGLIKIKARQTISEYAPESHKVKQGTPTMGGLIVLAGLIPALVINGMAFGTAVYYLVAMVVAFAIIGFIDDFVIPRGGQGKRGLGWLPKLVMQAAAAVTAPIALALPVNVGTWAACVVIVLFCCNAFNFADGLDGLAGSIGVILALTFSALLLVAQPTSNVGPFMAVAGALIPFLFLNAMPAKVFMGDVGSMPIGAMFGVMVLGLLRGPIYAMFDPVAYAAEDHPPMLVPDGALWLPVVVASVILIIELLPVPMQVGYFKLTKGKRLFPMTPIHHGFEKKGWPESRVLWSFVLAQVLASMAALYLLIKEIPVNAPQ